MPVINFLHKSIQKILSRAPKRGEIDDFEQTLHSSYQLCCHIKRIFSKG